MYILNRLGKALLIVVTALYGRVGTGHRAFDESITLDSNESWLKAKWSPRQRSISSATCVPAQDYPEGSGSAGGVLGDGRPDITEYAFGVYEDAQTRHVTFGAGSFALNALGFSASANRRSA
ncbi:hypothetical protein Q8F57_045390 [Paraburkholderia terrae]|uniref:hypothetical protein n=1 Tax=Paraburkholderia terrae TaxID=311230 RepID=UPI00296AD26D|nr:hypothetical protein [Paraburkholderia terrae]MDW3660623.1 hypothetical protein [Paraburkholderia terrae]